MTRRELLGRAAVPALELLSEISDVLSSNQHLRYPKRRGIDYYTGRALLMLGRNEEAGQRLDQALEAQVSELGTEHLAIANTHWLIGLCRWRSGDPVEGENGPMYRFTRSQLLACEGQVDAAEGELLAAQASGLDPWRAALHLRLHPRSDEPAFQRLSLVLDESFK